MNESRIGTEARGGTRLAGCVVGLGLAICCSSQALPQDLSRDDGYLSRLGQAQDISQELVRSQVQGPQPAVPSSAEASGRYDAELNVDRPDARPADRVLAPLTGPATTTQLSLLGHLRASPSCQVAFFPPASLGMSEPVATAPLLSMDALDLKALRGQWLKGPFLQADDHLPGSPGELRRLALNAAKFLAQGEASLGVDAADAKRATHGSLTRDAAFFNLVWPSEQLDAELRRYLLTEARAPGNDFSGKLCLREGNGEVRDAWFMEASWLARYAFTYDAARAQIPSADRALVESFIRRNAYFLAAQLDYGLNHVFPARLLGNYAQRASAAAATGEAGYLSLRFDTNADCRIDAADDARDFPVFAYRRTDGTSGPRLSVLSQWYNNRKSMGALAVGIAGALLADNELVLRSKRYFMEWLTFSVYPDGSEGEYSRNGDYCIANQGVIYAVANAQGAMLLADLLARRGDLELLRFTTRDGLFGTQVPSRSPAKSLELVISTHLALAQGRLDWHAYKGGGAAPALSASAHLGRMESQFLGIGSQIDNFHQVGFLLGARHFPALPIEAVVLRDPKATSLRWPGGSGNSVATGFGSWLGAWTDVFNLYPTAFMLRSN